MNYTNTRWSNTASKNAYDDDDYISDFDFRAGRLKGAIRKAREMGEEVPVQFKSYFTNPSDVSDEDVEDFIADMSKKYKDYGTNKSTEVQVDNQDDDIIMIPDEDEDTDSQVNSELLIDDDGIPIAKANDKYSEEDVFFDDVILSNPSTFNNENYDMMALEKNKRKIFKLYDDKIIDLRIRGSINGNRPNPDPILLEVLERIPGCKCKTDYHSLIK